MRLIDADEFLQDNIWECFDEWGNYTRAGQAVADAPTIDAVEVVRCKDCIHYESDGGALMVCRIDNMVVDDIDYCSYGEREDK